MSLLSFDIFTSSGDCLQFHSDDEAHIARILSQLNNPRVFSTKTLIICSEFSVTNIPGEKVEAIRLRSISPESFGLDDLDGMLVEIPEDEFESEYAALTPEERVAARHAIGGEIIQVFLRLNLQSGRRFHLKLTVPKKSGPEGRNFFTHLFEQPVTAFSLREGGKGFVNPRRLASLMNFPGPGHDVLPGNTLFAEPENMFFNPVD